MSEEWCFEVRKNSFSVVRIRRTLYQGNDLLDVRVWSEDMNGNATPTKQGISLQFEKLPELLDALRKLEAASRERVPNPSRPLSVRRVSAEKRCFTAAQS